MKNGWEVGMWAAWAAGVLCFNVSEVCQYLDVNLTFTMVLPLIRTHSTIVNCSS